MRASRAILAVLALALTSALCCASDNSKSTLEVFALLEAAGSSPISTTPPPPIDITPKPPSLLGLEQQLAADEQVLAEQQTALTNAQSTLAFWEGTPEQPQPAEVQQINVPIWTQAVASDQHTVATVQAQINQLFAEIAAQ
jgi:hypothetical protein